MNGATIHINMEISVVAGRKNVWQEPIYIIT